jgi:hypothetical protein
MTKDPKGVWIDELTFITPEKIANLRKLLDDAPVPRDLNFYHPDFGYICTAKTEALKDLNTYGTGCFFTPKPPFV